MIPAAFTYHVPATITEASALLVRYGDDAKILSGGQSLIPLMKLRLASPQHIIDINRVPGLAYVREDDGVLRIGALARESDLDESDLVRSRYPILHDTSRVIADPLVRNLATVCGNLAHADPANDHPATMLALGVEVVAVGPGGERRLPIGTFFTGPFTTALAPGEILTEIRVPAPRPRTGGAYQKTGAEGRGLRDRGCRGAGDARGGRHLRARRHRPDQRRGRRRPRPRALRRSCGASGRTTPRSREAGRLAAEECEPTEDGRGSVEYKRDLVRVLTVRALRQALARAGGGR